MVCFHVMSKERQIALVRNNERNSKWEFLCGRSDHDAMSFQLASLEQVTKWDKTVNEVFDLPKGYSAKRTGVGLSWNRYKTYY